MVDSQDETLVAPIPMRWLGPIRIGGNVFTGEQ